MTQVIITFVMSHSMAEWIMQSQKHVLLIACFKTLYQALKLEVSTD
jgi:hypothetical protein